MTTNRYPFEGEQMTAGEINRRYPAYSAESIRRYMRTDNPPTDLAGLVRCEGEAKARCVAAARRNGFNNRARPQVFGKGVRA